MDKSITDYFSQQHKREEQLYSEVLKCFERHKENTLKDLKVFQHNYKLSYKDGKFIDEKRGKKE